MAKPADRTRTLISVSFLLGILLIIIGLPAGLAGYIRTMSLFVILGLVLLSVGLVTALVKTMKQPVQHRDSLDKADAPGVLTALIETLLWIFIVH